MGDKANTYGAQNKLRSRIWNFHIKSVQQLREERKEHSKRVNERQKKRNAEKRAAALLKLHRDIALEHQQKQQEVEPQDTGGIVVLSSATAVRRVARRSRPFSSSRCRLAPVRSHADIADSVASACTVTAQTSTSIQGPSEQCLEVLESYGNLRSIIDIK